VDLLAKLWTGSGSIFVDFALLYSGHPVTVTRSNHWKFIPSFRPQLTL